MRALRGRGYPN